MGWPFVKSSKVDAVPSHVPPSNTPSIRLFRVFITPFAVIGGGCPLRFALGAVIGPEKQCYKFMAIVLLGDRNEIVELWVFIDLDKLQLGCRFKIRVKGPGQKV